MRIPGDYHRLSAQEREREEWEIQRLHRLGCERSILRARFGNLLVKSALGKLENTTEGGNDSG